MSASGELAIQGGSESGDDSLVAEPDLDLLSLTLDLREALATDFLE